MILVAAHVEVVPEHADQAQSIARALIAEARRAEGCLSYEIGRDLDRPGRLLLVAAWRDRAALDAHEAAPHTRAFRQGLADLTVISRAMTLREAADAPLD